MSVRRSLVRISEKKMSWEESVIFFANLAHLKILNKIPQSPISTLNTRKLMQLYIYNFWRMYFSKIREKRDFSTPFFCPIHVVTFTLHWYQFWRQITVFPHIVAAATILFWIHLVRKLFKERKLFKGGNYMRKYGIF